MGRERLEKEPKAETLLPQLHRETSIPASTSARIDHRGVGGVALRAVRLCHH
jgi:hypothetical protein